MRKVVRLTESDLVRLIKRVINEDETSFGDKFRRGIRKAVNFLDKNTRIAERTLKKYVKAGKITEEERDEIMDNISEELDEINPYPYEKNRESEVNQVVVSAVKNHLEKNKSLSERYNRKRRY